MKKIQFVVACFFPWMVTYGCLGEKTSTRDLNEAYVTDNPDDPTLIRIRNYLAGTIIEVVNGKPNTLNTRGIDFDRDFIHAKNCKHSHIIQRITFDDFVTYKHYFTVPEEKLMYHRNVRGRYKIKILPLTKKNLIQSYFWEMGQ